VNAIDLRLRPATGPTVGDHVEAGQPLLELHLDDVTRVDAAKAALADAIEITDGAVDPPPLVLGRVG